MKTYPQTRVLARMILALPLFAIGMVAAPPTAHGQTFKVLYSFTGGADGGQPYAGLVSDASGDLYGTTVGGGDAGCFIATCGVVFELSPASGGWSESVLHTFTGGSDGGNPFDSLVVDAAGNLYGTAPAGGSGGCTFGCGVVFKLSPGSDGWTETVLYSFQGPMSGYYPIAGLVFDKQGNLYSTMSNGGGTEQPGIVYELIAADGWNEEILYSFGGNDSGVAPMAAPIFDAKGNLYGTTSCCSSGGAVWELMHGTWKEKTLYAFQSGGGSNPEGSLVFDKAGNLYGTTVEGGGKNQKGRGVVFKLAKSKGGKWKETVLHVFRGGNDGQFLYGTPVLDKAGNLYGTTEQDGKYGCGTVFKLTPHSGGIWKETVLHQFTGGSDGCAPVSEALILDAAGNLYGTTAEGGNPGCYDKNGCGVVFEITH